MAAVTFFGLNSSAGIEVIASRKGSDGRMRIAMCGAATGRLNVYTIPSDALPQALDQGFELLVTRKMSSQVGGPATSRRGPALSRTPRPDSGAAASRPIPVLW